MQQLIDLRHVRHIGRSAHQAMHQTRLGIDADMRFHPEEIHAPLLRLMHFGIAFAVFILGRTRRMNDRRIDHRTIAQHQATVAQINADDLQNPAGQFMFLQQAPEVEDRGFIGNPIQMQSRKLTQDSGLVQRLFHRRIAGAEPVLHQMK
uniref:Putative transposase subunit n=1 Tax=uncultured proteobacterium QS1 TaxID=288647 RepID=Q6B379_9PROT|nr:putative transposase subunit [uncultured proteobacterium QS1]